ncbi:MAG: orotidine-5'-phosphate decarboxylase [Candidatus Omnitrophota bacterium]
MNNKIIVALDVDSLEKAKELVDKLYPTIKIFKIGSELFTAAGPEAVKMVKAAGADVFLDLKFHDIPNTVAKAIKAACKLHPIMLNIHASGGSEMIKAAAGAIKSLPKDRRPVLLAVTVLTSMDKSALNKLGISRPPIRQVMYLAKLAKQSGADGVVCSPQEISAVRAACGRNFVIVTPGVRPATSAAFDQKRIATPQWALKKGADFIVIGRPITEAIDPAKAARELSTTVAEP